ncbi:TPA: hypothetical protein HA361_06825 [Candidatus Woesearchaeota archaeon]|nr:hypothetical protein [Candidatus Woesearchaeota archaeon]HII69191.1 hypothetical protein [Candidatus Woesearchaeota archaeon]
MHDGVSDGNVTSGKSKESRNDAGGNQQGGNSLFLGNEAIWDPEGVKKYLANPKLKWRK